MTRESKYTFKKILIISVWIILLSGTVVLLIAAMSKKRNEAINRVEIKISGIQSNYFLGKKDVLDILQKVNGKKLEGESIHSLDFSKMEAILEKNQWIRKAEIFFDNNNVLQVKIIEREPIARIFTNSGWSFYIDSSLTRLPLSEKFSPRLPVFSSFPDVTKTLNKEDSNLLFEIKTLSEYINNHPFWMAQIDQVNITSEGSFELIPKLGEQLIRFGNTDNYEEKFNKLLAFYQKVESKVGWNNYSVLDIRYKNQVVGVIRDAAEIKSDSLKSVQIMKSIIAEAQKNSNDSTMIQLPQPKNENYINANHPSADLEPGENKVEENSPVVSTNSDAAKPVIKKGSVKESKRLIRESDLNKKKQTIREEKSQVMPPKKEEEKAAEIKKEPKAVMPPKSDY